MHCRSSHGEGIDVIGVGDFLTWAGQTDDMSLVGLVDMAVYW